MTRPRLLDLFSGAGGSAVGYHRAGFDIVGVDNRPMPRYPYKFIQADALNVLQWIVDPIHVAGNYFVGDFDVIHASPPCQAYTTMSNRARGDHPDLLEPVLTALTGLNMPWIVENVPGARSKMRGYTVTLTGGMFGLDVNRPRLFASNALLLVPSAPAVIHPIGVYGKHHDGRRLFTRADGTEQRAATSLAEAQAAMGIDWMTWDELREAIPPAYTAFIGAQLLNHLRAAA